MKPYPTFRLLSLLAFAVSGITVSSAPAAILSGDTGSHDPSRMIFCNGKYYVYSTGGGMKSSSDGVNWKTGPSPFATGSPRADGRPGRGTAPASMKTIVPEDRGIWAPDIIFYHQKYHLYYSVAAPRDVAHCAIGLLTSPTLDPASPDYKWTDAGVVISTWNKVEKKSAIDPAPFVDAKGDLWLAWGSGYANGAKNDDPTFIISKLDNLTGLLSAMDTTQYPVAPGHIEAAYVHYREGFYYAFWNDGGCCSGIESTYQIHVARSASPTGPYTNKAGKKGGNDIFMVTIKEKAVYGPGHMGIVSDPGLDRFSFHHYNAKARPVLGVRTLVWGADGWPSVGEDLTLGTYKITNSKGLALGVRGGGSTDGGLIELQTYTGNDFQKWSVSVTPEGYYQLTSVGSGKPFELSAPSADTNTTPAAIDKVPASTGSHPQWIIEPTSDGKTYCLKSNATHEVLAVPADTHGGGKQSGALTTSAWSNLPTQKWIFSAP